MLPASGTARMRTPPRALFRRRSLASANKGWLNGTCVVSTATHRRAFVRSAPRAFAEDERATCRVGRLLLKGPVPRSPVDSNDIQVEQHFRWRIGRRLGACKVGERPRTGACQQACCSTSLRAETSFV